MKLRLPLLPLLALLPLALLGRDPADAKPATTGAKESPAASSERAAPGAVGDAATDLTLLSSKYTNSLVLKPGEDAGNIAQLVARLLQRSHYTQQRFDDTISVKFFDRYLDALDPQRLYFLETDMQEFERYRTHLDELTLPEKGRTDTSPAFEIFNRFLQRFDQQYALVMEQLKTGKFSFDGDDRYVANRKDEPRPKSLADAKKLWHDRLRYEYLQEKLNNSTPEETVKTLTRRYNRTLRALKQYDNDEVLQLYLDSLAHAYDPHSDYFGKSELDNFSINMNLSLFGIGATLQSEDGYTVIKTLVPGGPAERSKKLKVNDKIVAVAQASKEWVDVVDEKLRKVVEMIRGPKDTEVRLTIIPGEASDPSVRKVITLVRDEIKLEDQEAKSKIIDMPDGTGKTVRVGLIDLPSFYADFPVDGRQRATHKSTTQDVSRLVEKLKKEHVEGLILDLRRNGGGSLEEAINLTGLFIKSGPVVQVRDPNGRINVDNDENPAILYDGPLVVLTSRFSASASEILAGALQDYGRALIVGDSSTHGKGTVQTLQQLGQLMKGYGMKVDSNPGATKITIRKFYRASGASTQLKGVVPDVVLPSVNNIADVGESSLSNALQWDTIPSAEFDKVNLVQPFLTELQRRSTERVAKDKDWDYVREDIERYRKQKDEKAVSLNEAARQKEKDENKARVEARKKELLARSEHLPTAYEITLKIADQPGLPAPMTNKLVTAVSKADERLLHPDKKDKGGKPEAKPAPSEKPDDAAKVAEIKPRSDDDEDATETEAEGIAADVMLNETQRVLLDLIALSSGKSPTTARAN